MVTRLGWVLLCRKLPDQEPPLAPSRCRYLERYYNRMLKEKYEGAKKHKNKEEKEKKQKKVPPCLSVYLFACSYLQTPPPGPKAPKTKGSGPCYLGGGLAGDWDTSLVLFCASPPALWSLLRFSYGGSSPPPWSLRRGRRMGQPSRRILFISQL